jgi:hypothetical protein
MRGVTYEVTVNGNLVCVSRRAAYAVRVMRAYRSKSDLVAIWTVDWDQIDKVTGHPRRERGVQ